MQSREGIDVGIVDRKSFVPDVHVRELEVGLVHIKLSASVPRRGVRERLEGFGEGDARSEEHTSELQSQ